MGTKKWKPECKLMGENGNVFNLIGIAKKTLIRARLRDEANEMAKRCFAASSYDEVLNILGDYVKIV